jgi:threonine dehydrogenase-like Zn-dependent dehydrogenase
MERTYPMAFIATPGRVEFRDRTLPALHDKSVLLKVKAASICGSDLHIYKGKHPGAPLPAAIGHELSGEVLQIGKSVSKVKEGDRVALEPVVVCGECHFCRRGEYNLCLDASVQYRKGQGAFTRYFVADEAWVHKLPPGLSYEEGALVEPLAVAVHAVKRSGIRLGHSVALFGAGAIGLMIMHLAKLSGAAETFVVDVKEFRLERAKKLGASWVVNALQEEPVSFILGHTDGFGVDRAFEAVGTERTLLDTIKAIKKGGTAIVLGVFEDQEVRIPANIIGPREITVKGSAGFCWDFQDALNLVAGGAVNLREMVMTDTLPLADLQKGFDLLMDPHSQSVKVVIQCD